MARVPAMPRNSAANTNRMPAAKPNPASRPSFLAGSTVRRLVSDVMAAGDHAVQWDGTDDDGVAVADGYYFVKVGSQDFYRTSFLQKASVE